uniref:AMP-binding protein n=1 Tax=Xinfangfangia pollutisoli TaxID=2865960 RepID=UPI001CD488A9
MRSTMQDARLGIARLLRHTAQVTGAAPVVAETPQGRSRSTLADLADRAGRLADALARRGIGPGAVVASFAAASPEHLEAYLAVPALGAVLHTLNIRLHDGQLAEMAVEAGDLAVLVDGALAQRFATLAPLLAGSPIRLVIVTGDPDPAPFPGLPVETIGYEALLAEGAPRTDWPDPDEDAAAILCYTGGTTGRPKGVAYSHRSLWLQAMSLCTANSLGIGADQVILPAVPFYHVNGWGIPYAAMMAGAGLVLPGTRFQPEVLNPLLDSEGVTLAAGVPTIWSDVLAARRAQGLPAPPRLKRLVMGGAPVPDTLVAGWGALGVMTQTAWGMTETSSMSAIGRPSGRRAEPGRLVCGLEARSVATEGASAGEIQIRGPWVTAGYFRRAADDGFQDGWLRTGDLGTLDGTGQVTLTDRLKDAIKSGGEWIPSLPLEEAIRSHAAVRDVAVIALPDPRWQERPLALVVPAGPGFDPGALAAHLGGLVARWW